MIIHHLSVMMNLPQSEKKKVDFFLLAKKKKTQNPQKTKVICDYATFAFHFHSQLEFTNMKIHYGMVHKV